MTFEKIEKIIVLIEECDVIKFCVHNDEIFKTLDDPLKANGHGRRYRVEREVISNLLEK